MLFENSRGKPVAVFGAGVSGKTILKYLDERGIPAVLYDESGRHGSQTSFTEESAKSHDIVVYSPGFPPEHPWLTKAAVTGLTKTSEPEFASIILRRVCPDTLITAVTGTNGKTTLTEFLAFAHREFGKTSAAVGNNGIPVTSLLLKDSPKVDFPVCEISSFQAETLTQFIPKNLLWTNFDEDHIDRHGSAENYFRAKFHLVELQQESRQNCVCIIGESVADAAKRFNIKLPEFAQVATREEVHGKIPENSIFNTFPQSENYALARRYWLANGFPIETLEMAAKKFTAKPHRLARCGVANIGNTQIEFWNDSKGTNFHAVYAALKTFSEVPVFWIGGGLGKGGDLIMFCQRLAPKISAAFLIGGTAPALLVHFLETGTPAQRFETLADAVNAAFAAASHTDSSRAVILFSPGFASFDMFKSYADRGNAFETLVKQFI